mmetsp:Transcript_129619/g.276456  ORF Transcript_129619/g.276456 Transcript_129619/m.276456 type:complete len:694 (-) Transcript_129619:36-2117(-)
MAPPPVDWLRAHDQWGVLDPSTEEPGFGQCLWNAKADRTLRATPESGARTLVEVLVRSREQHSERRAVGWRETIRSHEVEGESSRLELANEYQWLTYVEYYNRVLSLARGFACAGLEPEAKVIIWAETQRDWMTSAFAAFHSNAKVVAVPATLSADEAMQCMNEMQATTVVVDVSLLKALAEVLPKWKGVKHVVTLTPCEASAAAQVKARGAVNLHSVDELVEMGRTWSFSPKLPQPEDVAVIMYTSGASGARKPVVLQHSSMVAALAGLEESLKGAVTPEDVCLCYLPLAHVMEMATEVCLLSMGAALGFGRADTLMDSGAKLKRPESMGDAPCLHPTFMVFGPSALGEVQQAIEGRRASFGMLGRGLFSWGLRSGERHHRRGRIGANRFYNGLIFKKVQRLLGGRLRAAIAASAPLASEVQKFFQTCLDAPVRQGYGLTEGGACSCLAFWGDNGTNSAGPPMVSTVLRLADWPEGGYLNSDKDKEGIAVRRGEVLIGGPAISQGYFVSPARPNSDLEKRNKGDWIVIQGMRFFRTGDIGQIHSNGTLEIIDRKDAHWKGPAGACVALAKVEAALQGCDCVDTAICYGKAGSDFLMALICPQRDRVLAIGKELKLECDFETLCKDARVVEKVAEACQTECSKQKLADFEVPKKYLLLSEPWTLEKGELTEALAPNRLVIAAEHQADIDSLYA